MYIAYAWIQYIVWFHVDSLIKTRLVRSRNATDISGKNKRACIHIPRTHVPSRWPALLCSRSRLALCGVAVLKGCLTAASGVAAGGGTGGGDTPWNFFLRTAVGKPGDREAGGEFWTTCSIISIGWVSTLSIIVIVGFVVERVIFAEPARQKRTV